MNDLWKKILAEIEIETSRSIFMAFFKASDLLSMEENVAIISTKSEMHTNYIKTRYTDLIKKLLAKHTGQVVEIEFISGLQKESNIAGKNDPGPLFVADIKAQAAAPRPLPRIRVDYTFDNLAVSESSNQLAYTAALTVANNPGTKYNPLFFYGTVGVGKTHLMHSIANKVYQQNPRVNVLYLSTEEFTNEIVESIQRKSTTQMRKKFRTVDLLLLDDIQFLSGKEKVQEELFHTFNTLIDRQSQIVFSSDRPPFELKIEPRLVSRFEGGLTVDIQAPDLEMRIAILLLKSKKFGLVLGYEEAGMIAELVQNTRGLEGALLKISSLALARNDTVVTAALIHQALGSKGATQSRSTLHPDDIINLICDYYGIKPKQLKGSKRDAMLVKPRQLCMFILKEEAKLPYAEIGNLLGGRDHTTVMHGVEKVKSLLDNSPKTREDMLFIKKKISDGFAV